MALVEVVVCTHEKDTFSYKLLYETPIKMYVKG